MAKLNLNLIFEGGNERQNNRRACCLVLGIMKFDRSWKPSKSGQEHGQEPLFNNGSML